MDQDQLLLDLDSTLQRLPLLLLSSDGLGAHNTTTPMSSVFLILVAEAVIDRADQLAQFVLVLLLDFSQSNNSSSLLVHYSTKSGLALDNGIWHTHLSAKGREVDDELDWVDVVRNEDKGCLLVLDKTNNMVESILDCVRLLASILLLLALRDSGGLGL